MSKPIPEHQLEFFRQLRDTEKQHAQASLCNAKAHAKDGGHCADLWEEIWRAKAKAALAMVEHCAHIISGDDVEHMAPGIIDDDKRQQAREFVHEMCSMICVHVSGPAVHQLCTAIRQGVESLVGELPEMK